MGYVLVTLQICSLSKIRPPKLRKQLSANAWHFMLQVASTNSSSRHREVLIVAPGTKP